MRITKQVIILLFLASAALFAQRTPDPNTGNVNNTRWGLMDGNLVRTVFANHGEIANWDWEEAPSGEWPKGSGHTYVDGVALVVAAPVIDADGKLKHSVVTRYREDMDVSPDGLPWGFAALPGYFNPDPKINTLNSPAMSSEPTTWPDAWPDKPADWAGVWNGFFGKGVKNADLETYMVFDDDPDEEILFYPDANDPERRGLGLEVAARFFQWNQVLAQDVIFAIYFITNEGTTNYDSTYFAFHIDWGIGGHNDSADDGGNYDLDLDIAWAFDGNGYGSPGNWAPVGVTGFAFLESPSISYDGRDNDRDGLIDERRDSGPGALLESYPYGIDDVTRFQETYPDVQLRPHYSGDENMNWDAFEDLNENGVWDEGEPLRDDVGADGIGPFNEEYTGPDAGEADGIPTAGEPDFDFLDKDESDQIGLTGFNVFPLHEYKMEYDEAYWNGLASAPPPRDKLVQNTNLGMFFSSGPFKLNAGETQFYSMALLFGEDQRDLARAKKTVQQIYNSTYRFTKPPDKSQLTAIAGDKKVTLYWNDRAENSWDPFLQEFDFEGYRIYRATDPEFLETQVITDSYGKKRFRKPLTQFDLKNGIKGLHPIDVAGIKFDLGEDTGLKHFYVDTDVINGQTYYYAVVPYDRGLIDTTATGEISGFSPTEAPGVIKVSTAGVVEQLDINTAVVVPNPPVAGYLGPEVDSDTSRIGPYTGNIQILLLDPDRIKSGEMYEVLFADTSRFATDPVPTYSLINLQSGDTLFRERPIREGRDTSPVLDGLVLQVQNDTSARIIEAESNWTQGNSNYIVTVDTNRSLIGRFVAYPADFEINFYDTIVDTSEALLFGQKKIPTNFSVWNVTEGRQMDFLFFDNDEDSEFSPGDKVTIIVGNGIGESIPTPRSKFKVTWSVTVSAPASGDRVAPQAGDVFRIRITKPFRSGDAFQFKIKGQQIDGTLATQSLDEIAVVPNPYVAAASWETRSPFSFGRGERKIFFINLPKDCTIRIYTVRGYLVDTIEHHGNELNGAASWDLETKDGLNVAYGLYIYHVDAPGVGKHIGKFAVIK